MCDVRRTKHKKGISQLQLIPFLFCLEPVSYTHLDVYKRQSHNRRLSDDDPVAVIDEQSPADGGSGVYLYAGLSGGALRNPPCQKIMLPHI